MKKNLVETALAGARDSVFYTLSCSLAEQYPDKYIAESEYPAAWIPKFAEAGGCELDESSYGHCQISTHYDGEVNPPLVKHPSAGYRKLLWQGHEMEWVLVSLAEQFGDRTRSYFIASTEAVANGFIADLTMFANDMDSVVLVFDECFTKDAHLFAAIQSAS